MRSAHLSSAVNLSSSSFGKLLKLSFQYKDAKRHLSFQRNRRNEIISCVQTIFNILLEGKLLVYLYGFPSPLTDPPVGYPAVTIQFNLTFYTHTTVFLSSGVVKFLDTETRFFWMDFASTTPEFPLFPQL